MPWALYGLALAAAIVGAVWWAGGTVGRGILAFAALAFLTVVLRRHPVDTVGVAVGGAPALVRLGVLLPVVVAAGFFLPWTWQLAVWVWCAYQIRRGWVGPPEGRSGATPASRAAVTR